MSTTTRNFSKKTWLLALATVCGASTAEAIAQTSDALPPRAPAVAAQFVAPQIAQSEIVERIAAPSRETVVLDVRTAAEFAAGHVPGAINIPHDQVVARIAELAASKDAEIVVYCRSGRRSALALQALHAAGFPRLRHLDGDFLAWQSAGLPLETAPAPAAAPADSAKP